VWVVGVSEKVGRAIGHVGSPREVLVYFDRFPGVFPVIQPARTFCAGSWPYPDDREAPRGAPPPSEDLTLRALGLLPRSSGRAGRHRAAFEALFGLGVVE